MANKRSYTEYNGSIFADGIARKVWTGEVVHDQDETILSQTASMTWGSVCDAETFLLEIPTKFVNGTLIVAKTIPCEKGGPFDICVVELELDLPDEGPGLREHGGIVSGGVRCLRGTHDKNERESKLDAVTKGAASVRRQLQSTTQIDIMFFYTPGGRDILGVSDSQMQSELAGYLVTANEAMVNSDVDLQFSLVRVEPLPYTEESNMTSVVLGNLEGNSDVADLRDVYEADLVHLVANLGAGDFGDGSCGLANTPVSPDEALAFGVVDPYCFFQFSHTHEIVHNFGCYHDRESSDTQHEYAHGYRYCDGDLPFRTLMTYVCLDEDGFPLPVSRVNYLSSPDITLNGRPTGTTEDDCARRVKETMGDVANYRGSSSSSSTPAPSTPITLELITSLITCSNGISGVERDRYCCPLVCGACGGTGCSQRARVAGLTSDDCCVTRIGESGVYCDDSGTAPCIIGEAPTPAEVSATPEPSSLAPTPESATPEPFMMTEFMEVGERTTVVVSANGFDERTSDYGCAPDGCVAANTRDGSLSTRWSCKDSLLGGINCEITYEFGETQDFDEIRIAFHRGTERTRKLKVKINGSKYTEIASSGQTDDFEDFELEADNTSEVSLEALELGSDDWISLTEVQFVVP